MVSAQEDSKVPQLMLSILHMQALRGGARVPICGLCVTSPSEFPPHLPSLTPTCTLHPDFYSRLEPLLLLVLFFLIHLLIYLYMCMYMNTCATARAWMSEDNLWKSVLSSTTGRGVLGADWTRVVRLGDECLYPWSHILGPKIYSFNQYLFSSFLLSIAWDAGEGAASKRKPQPPGACILLERAEYRRVTSSSFRSIEKHHEGN